jgi:outer membrane lipoprotein-sorting protein
MTKQLFITALLLCASASVFSQEPATAGLTADDIMQRVFAHDAIRESQARGYVGSREYVLENKKLNKRAVMSVAIFADADGTKHFQVVSEEGWKSANKHVLRKMLESESDSSNPTTRPRTRIVPENYEFELAGSESLTGRPAYVIDVVPKRSDKYLFRGRIWVDAEDYAVARVEGQPAKNPSFWTRSVHFVQQYRKEGPFWFPANTTSVTEAMIFGTTDVTIRYFDYQPACGTAAAEKPMEAHYVQH